MIRDAASQPVTLDLARRSHVQPCFCGDCRTVDVDLLLSQINESRVRDFTAVLRGAR